MNDISLSWFLRRFIINVIAITFIMIIIINMISISFIVTMVIFSIIISMIITNISIDINFYIIILTSIIIVNIIFITIIIIFFSFFLFSYQPRYKSSELLHQFLSSSFCLIQPFLSLLLLSIRFCSATYDVHLSATTHWLELNSSITCASLPFNYACL